MKKWSIFVVLSIVLSFATLTALPATAHAATTKETVCNAIGSGANCDDTNAGDLNSVIKSIINWLSLIVGLLAIVMIIFAGAKYITSGGDSNKVSSAKNALIYAIIGLVIVALSQVLVHKVLTVTKDATQKKTSVVRLVLSA